MRAPAVSFAPALAMEPVSSRSPPAANPLGETVQFNLGSLRVELPFQGKASEEAALARAKEADAAARPGSAAAPAEIGLTGEVPADLVRRIAAGALPFPQGAEQDRGKTAAAAPPATMPVETVTLPPGLVEKIAAAPLPFKAQPSPPAAVAGPTASPRKQSEWLTLEQYASFHAELAVFSERREAVLARYGLTDPGRRAAVEQGFHERLRRSPEDNARWQQLYHHYMRYWASRAGRPW